MTRGILPFLLACAISVTYAAQPPRGVAGIDVVVKQNPSKRAVTDARGNFALDGLAPGSHTLSFRAPKAVNAKTTTADKVVVGTSYSVKIEGVKRSVTQSGLTGDKLLAGIDFKIEVGSGAKVRGQVAAGALKKMVWIPKEPGSHIPGYWAEEGTVAASRANTQTHSQDDMREAMNRGNPNMTDAREGGVPATSGR